MPAPHALLTKAGLASAELTSLDRQPLAEKQKLSNLTVIRGTTSTTNLKRDMSYEAVAAKPLRTSQMRPTLRVFSCFIGAVLLGIAGASLRLILCEGAGKVAN